MNEEKDFYSLLNCSPSSTTDQITTEYRIKCLEHHPDRGGDESAFVKIQEAYNTLVDPNRRSGYDRWLHSGCAVSYKEWTLARMGSTMHWRIESHPATITDEPHSEETMEKEKKTQKTTAELKMAFRTYRL